MGIERKIFLDFLTDTKTGKSYYVDNGIVKLSTEPTFLPQTHDGWLAMQVSFARSQKYYGINRAFTTPLKFVNDGAQILRNKYYGGKGVEEPITLIILKWNDTNDIYELYYKGDIDFTQVNDEVATGITVNSIEGGILKLLKAHESTVYEIPCDGSIPENFQVNIDGMLFDCVFKYANTTVTQENFNGTLFFIPGLTFLSSNGLSFGVETGSQQYEVAGPVVADYYRDSNNYIMRPQSATTVVIDGNIKYLCTDEGFHPGRGALRLYFRTSLGNIYDIQTVVDGKLFLGVETTRPVSMTINLAAGEKLFFGAVFVPSATERLEVQFLDNSDLNFTIKTRYPATKTWAITWRDLFKLLVEKIGGGVYLSQSELLDSWPNLAITSGFALRNDPKAVIKTTLLDCFESANAVLNSSLSNIGDNDTLFLERKDYVFNPASVTMDVGNVSNLKLSAYENYFNTIKIGYPEQSYDEKLGQNEYNTTSLWNTPFTKIGAKELTLVSKYRADAIGIEMVRSNPFVLKSTTNNNSDNSTFILNIDVAGRLQQYYNADKTIAETGLAGTQTIKYNVTGGAFFNADSTNQNFLFFRTIAATANITVTNIIVDGSTGSKRVTLFRNGTDNLGSLVFNADGATHFFTVPALAIMPNDTFHVEIENLGVSATYDINAAGLRIAFTDIYQYGLKRVAYDSASGVPNIDTCYNIEDLTPKRMLQRHTDWIHSFLQQLPDTWLTFQTSDKNPNLSTTLAGVTVTENAILPVASMLPPMFYPIVAEFDTKVPANFVDLLSGAANGYIQLEYNGVTIYGFPLEVMQRPALNESQTWKILLSPLTDIKLFYDLDVNGLNYLQLAAGQSFISHLNPVQSVPLNLVVPAQYHFKTMDSDWFKEQIKFYTTQTPYFQPWQTNDLPKLQCQTNGLGPVQVELLDCNGNVIGSPFALATTADPAIVLPQILYEGNIPLTGLAEGIYYLLWTFGTGGTTAQWITEGMQVKDNFDAASEPTLLFEYFDTKNKQSTIFSTGYNPSMRVHGYLMEYNPEAKFAVYEDQPADIELLNGIPYRTFKLMIETGDGVPDWVIDKVNRIMLLNRVKIDGVYYTRDANATWEKISTPGQPKKYWSLQIREAQNRDGVTLNTDGTLDGDIVVVYNINTKGFGDGNNTDNIIEVTKID